MLLLWFLTVTCSWCLYLYFGSASMLVTYFVNFRYLNDHLFGKELFIRFTAIALRKLPSIHVFSYFPFGFEGRMWDLIVSLPDHCLSFYFDTLRSLIIANKNTNGDYIQQQEYMPFYNLSQKKQTVDAEINGLERLEYPIYFAIYKSFVLNPCGHLFCELCANTLFSMSQKCTLCNSKIDGI